MSKLWQDFRFAARTLAKNPGFTLVAVLTLALGIGANTAIFSVVNASLLKPLPYPDPGKVLIYWETHPNFGDMSISYPDYLDWRREIKSLKEMAVYRRDRFNLTGSGKPEQVRATMVSANIFDALGVQPLLGRAFRPDEDKVGAEPVAILTYGFWERRFGGDPEIVGQSLTLNGKPYQVVGVMPSSVRHPTRSDLFVPIGQFAGNPSWVRGNHPGIYGLGRLADGATLSEAQAEIDAISHALGEQYPATNRVTGVKLRVLQDYVVSDVRPALLLLSGAVVLVLLIACVNVANLSLARAAGRERELAVRAAVGAGRWQLARQLMTESVLLAVVGAAAGVALAYLGLALLRAAYGSDLPGAGDVSIDTTVLAFTLVLAVGTGLLFGLVPAFQAWGGRSIDALHAGARGGHSVGRRRFQTGLVVTEIALAIVLMVGAGLLLRSFGKILEVDPGLDPSHVLTAGVSLPTDRYDTDEKVRGFFTQVLEKMRALPGVTHAGLTTNLPFVGGEQTSFAIAGRPTPAPGEFPFAEYAAVNPDYFPTIGMRLLRGRLFNADDRADARKVMLIDRSFADTHWPGEDPVGKQVILGPHSGQQLTFNVVGVVDTVRHDGLDVEPPRPQMYFPFSQAPQAVDVTLVAKTATPPGELAEALRNAVLAVDPDQPLYDVRPYRTIVGDSLGGRRLSMSLFGFFAAIAAALALVGIYGVISYGVTRRTQELGVRIALGAGKGGILKLVLRQVGFITLLGVVPGVAGALALGSFMRGQLFGVSAHDPLVFLLVPAVVVSCALLACLLPARRAARIQPTEALRYE